MSLISRLWCEGAPTGDAKCLLSGVRFNTHTQTGCVTHIFNHTFNLCVPKVGDVAIYTRPTFCYSILIYIRIYLTWKSHFHCKKLWSLWWKPPESQLTSGTLFPLDGELFAKKRTLEVAALNLSDWSSNRSILFQPPFVKSAVANLFVFCPLCFDIIHPIVTEIYLVGKMVDQKTDILKTTTLHGWKDKED